MRLAAVDGRAATSRPTISSARSSSVVSVGHALADDLAAPDDRDPVGDLEHLVELVADEDDAAAARRRGGAGAAKISSVSWGVSTAVGSSRTRIRASR